MKKRLVPISIFAALLLTGHAHGMQQDGDTAGQPQAEERWNQRLLREWKEAWRDPAKRRELIIQATVQAGTTAAFTGLLYDEDHPYESLLWGATLGTLFTIRSILLREMASQANHAHTE